MNKYFKSIIGNQKRQIETDIKKSDNNLLDDDVGNRLFLLSLGQNLYEPLKITLLKKATYEHKNVLAALYLGNLYAAGLKKDDIVYIEKDYDEAAKAYNHVRNEDKYGVTDWLLGWFYQKNLITDAKKNDTKKNIEIAKNYYEKSKEKKYPKAYNSLGNFAHYGYAGYTKDDDITAINNYKIAADLNENYAILNCGHYYNKKYKLTGDLNFLNQALDYYKKSAELNSPEGLLKVAESYEILLDDDISLLNEVKNSYIKCMLSGANKFAIIAYCQLGNLISKYIHLQNDDDIINSLAPMKTNNLTIECLLKSYELFLKIIAEEKLSESEKAKYLEIFTNSISDN